MKKFDIILISLIMFFILISFYSIEILSQKINLYLINAIRFLLISSLLFLIFEKRILLNTRYVYKQIIPLGFLLTIYALTITYAISVSCFLYAIVFFIIPIYLVFINKRVLNYITIFILIALMIIAYKNSASLNLLSLPFFVISSIALYFLFIVFSKFKNTFNNYKHTSLFILTAIPAIVSIILFLIFKPIKAPMLSLNEQIHLILLILYTIVPVFLYLIIKRFSFGNNNMIILCVLFYTILALLFSSLTLINILLIPILLIPIMNFKLKKHKKASSHIKIVSIITLILIILSLIFPLYRTFELKQQIKKDIQLLKENKTNNSIISIGNIYIKIYKNKPVYLFDRQQDKIVVCPIN